MVIADTLAEAKDAAELVEIEYEPLPSVTLTEDTVKPGAPAVWDECPDNISNFVERGNKAATEEAIKGAARVIKRRYVITRVHAQYMEPRGTLGVYDQGEDRMTLYADVQYPHRVRNMLAQNVFKVPESKMRVITGDVGGGFGTKGWQYVEHRLTLWAARKLLRPVKWCCERSEAVMADEHGRDNVGEIELALDADNSGPVEVEGTGTFDGNGLYDVTSTCRATHTFAGGVKLTVGQLQKDIPLGATFIGTKGRLYVDRGKIESHPADLLKEPLTAADVHLEVSNDHQQNFLDCIKSRKSPISDVEIGHRSATLCHLGNIAVRLGRKIRWNAAEETITGDPEAAAMLERPYRSPWKLG